MVRRLKLQIGERIKSYMRVLRIAKKSGFDEFSEELKICLVGLVVVGIVGFVIYLVSVLLG
jgi:protein translocase SEC61 complex gamma subunit